MAVPGWYPDPDRTPGRYRYWDGRQWTAQTSTNPYGPAAGDGAGRPGRRTNRTALLIGGIVAVVVLVLITVTVIRSFEGSDAAVDDPNPPAPSVSGWDDSSPLPTASPTPTRSPSPSSSPTHSREPEPTSSVSFGEVACAAGNPGDRSPHPADGRVHGGQLSMAVPQTGGWHRDDAYVQGLSYAWDTSGATDTVEPEWWAMLAVGALHTDDGFKKPQQSATDLMQCIASSDYYQYLSGVSTVSSKPFSLDGRSGWTIRSNIRVDDPRVKASGDVAEVVVLDTGRPGQLSFFAGFVPIGDSTRLATLDATVADLRVDP